ncbi:MAG: hypothetical protein RI955_1264 [Bacteroidota bacterium]|jgi:hypothetical protein
MIKSLLPLFIFTLGLSCYANRTGKTVMNKSNQNIVFDFKVNYDDKKHHSFEVTASIFNNNTDTVYFLNQSCDGLPSLLVYDNNKFDNFGGINCNIAFPILEKIAPKGILDFKTHFRKNKKDKKIKLGIYFYTVHKSFNINKIDLTSMAQLILANQKDIILWANEKEIK